MTPETTRVWDGAQKPASHPTPPSQPQGPLGLLGDPLHSDLASSCRTSGFISTPSLLFGRN